MSTTVSTIDNAMEPRQPSRFEKKRNTHTL